MIDVLCVTKGEREPKGLEHIPGKYRLLTSDLPGWALAANRLLSESENDVLFLDDDIELTETTFALFEKYRDEAEVFGFTLITPGMGIQSAGHEFREYQGQIILNPQQTPENLFRPVYLAHVTASCFYIKREVIEAGVRFPVWPGAHYEDVAFTVDAWLHGFRVAYVPGLVYHYINASQGAGATKTQDDDFQQRRIQNERLLANWLASKNIAQAAKECRIPLGSVPIGGING